MTNAKNSNGSICTNSMEPARRPATCEPSPRTTAHTNSTAAMAAITRVGTNMLGFPEDFFTIQ